MQKEFAHQQGRADKYSSACAKLSLQHMLSSNQSKQLIEPDSPLKCCHVGLPEPVISQIIGACDLI